MKTQNVALKEISDLPDGILWVAEDEIPFDIKRVYFIDKLRADSMRGFHAHKSLIQVIFALRGSFELDLYDGEKSEKYVLKHNGQGIVIAPRIWHDMKNFKDDCLIAVFASDVYKEDDYIRSFHDFKHLVKGD